MPMEEGLLDDIIRRPLDMKNGWTTRQVQLTKPEIRQLCLASKEIFIGQPNLLKLDAPSRFVGVKIVDASYDQDIMDRHKCISYIRDYILDAKKRNVP